MTASLASMLLAAPGIKTGITANASSSLQILIERISKYKVSDFSIRIWSETILPEQYELHNLYDDIHGDLNRFGVQILESYKANAVEILDRDGAGVVMYANWP